MEDIETLIKRIEALERNQGRLTILDFQAIRQVALSSGQQETLRCCADDVGKRVGCAPSAMSGDLPAWPLQVWDEAARDLPPETAEI